MPNTKVEFTKTEGAREAIGTLLRYTFSRSTSTHHRGICRGDLFVFSGKRGMKGMWRNTGKKIPFFRFCSTTVSSAPRTGLSGLGEGQRDGREVERTSRGGVGVGDRPELSGRGGVGGRLGVTRGEERGDQQTFCTTFFMLLLREVCLLFPPVRFLCFFRHRFFIFFFLLLLLRLFSFSGCMDHVIVREQTSFVLFHTVLLDFFFFFLLYPTHLLTIVTGNLYIAKFQHFLKAKRFQP